MGLERGHPSGDQVEPVGGELGEEGAFSGDSLGLTISIYERVCILISIER